PALASINSPITSSAASASRRRFAPRSIANRLRAMPRESAAIVRDGPFGVVKAVVSIGALPRNPRAMLTYDATLAWSVLLLLAIGLVMVFSASISMAEVSPHTGY